MRTPSCISAKLVCLTLALLTLGAWAASAKAVTADPNIAVLHAILTQPESKIDLARVKLTVDHMINPSIDIEGSLQQLDGMVSTLRTGLPPNATSWQAMLGLRSYLYQAGPWNGYRPYEYDLADPYGHNIHNKLLPTYLTTRKGNCVFYTSSLDRSSE